MSRKAKTYTAQEKVKVVVSALQGDRTMAQLSSQYGVHATQINRWKKEAMEFMASGFQGRPKATDTSQAALIDQLYQQIGQLTVERDWLKKKSEVFEFKREARHG